MARSNFEAQRPTLACLTSYCANMVVLLYYFCVFFLCSVNLTWYCQSTKPCTSCEHCPRSLWCLDGSDGNHRFASSETIFVSTCSLKIVEIHSDYFRPSFDSAKTSCEFQSQSILLQTSPVSHTQKWPFQRKLWHRLTGKRSLDFEDFLGGNDKHRLPKLFHNLYPDCTSVPTCWMQPQYLSAAWIHVCVSILIIDRIGLEKIGYDKDG